ncbi:hypothetical protein [Xenorhabdus japonica]|uniref:Uncharacterized protein n=1 Tax=Xenorhabdus japonica TaxID=53341 RepID=A0A1I4YQI2_9GAMM|nr:hypothetical protein [Xenorhabdus japonica]SFN39890.1 hypothetical protein SAMN05421579_102181 [Xenorhabdus japonica]
MSKNSEKGRRGELAATAIFSNIGVHEKNIEVVRANTTTTPENGVDLALKVPHNLSTKLDEIVEIGGSNIALSSAQIDVRVQIKNYTKPINKSTMLGFVDDISKNLEFAEHWGIGGIRLTKGAQQVLENAKEIAPVKWYTATGFAKIQAHYPEIPFTDINEGE